MNLTIEAYQKVNGFDAEVVVGENVLSRLGFFLGVNEEKTFKELEHEVINTIDEMESNGELEESAAVVKEIIIATEDKADMSTYDSIVFDLELEINEYGDVTGKVIERK